MIVGNHPEGIVHTAIRVGDFLGVQLTIGEKDVESVHVSLPLN